METTSSSENPASSTKSVRCGCIGYGGAFNMGRRHLNEMLSAGMAPTAVAELDPARLEVARADFPGIQCYASVEEMLRQSDVELVAVITPHHTHARLAIQCLEAGRHVVTEKPFALTTQDCDRMIATAERVGRMVSTYHNRHWDGWIVRAVDQIVTQGVIGEVYKVVLNSTSREMPGTWWRASKSMSGGVLYDWGVHLLEYALQLMPGASIREVIGLSRSGFWRSQLPPESPWTSDLNEDEGRLIVRLDGERWIEMIVSTLDSRSHPNMLEVIGTLGSYQIDWTHWRLTHVRDGIKSITEGKHPASASHTFYQNVHDYLRGRAKLVITPQWARRLVHILDLGDQSAREGKGIPAIYA
jgi:scyllo-inositol 2-dehydrogenase (NADP+)